MKRTKRLSGQWLRSNEKNKLTRDFCCYSRTRGNGISPLFTLHSYLLPKKVPRFGRVDPIITCTVGQVGRLPAALLLPTSADKSGRRPANSSGSPASRGYNVGLTGSFTHQAGYFSLIKQEVIPRRRLRIRRPRRTSGPQRADRWPPARPRPRW